MSWEAAHRSPCSRKNECVTFHWQHSNSLEAGKQNWTKMRLLLSLSTHTPWTPCRIPAILIRISSSRFFVCQIKVPLVTFIVPWPAVKHTLEGASRNERDLVDWNSTQQMQLLMCTGLKGDTHGCSYCSGPRKRLLLKGPGERPRPGGGEMLRGLRRSTGRRWLGAGYLLSIFRC